MCGRFSFSTSKEKLKKQFGDIEVGENLRINFNVAPTQHAYVITNERPDQLQFYRWGLLPFWSKDGKVTGRLINARREGIESKPSFRGPIRRHRCWVLADSFYEWRKEGKQKIPYRIKMKNNELMVMAGIWDIWRGEGDEIRTFSIITGPPNREVSQLHNRMPVLFVDAGQRERYLLTDNLQEALDLLKPPPDGTLDFYRVSQQVNSPRNNSPELHEPVEDDHRFEV
jgi:putative SOS response-associated peptidase YedK